MEVKDFDNWRARYDFISYQEMVRFYNQVEADHPVQSSFDPEAWEAFFTWLPLERIEVFELGGWHGEMAAFLLPKFPAISRWLNWEISQAAVSGSVCKDERYKAVVPKNFAWNLKLPSHNVFVASHTLEHLKLWQVFSLFKRLPDTVKYIGLEIPVGEGDPDWTGYHGSHIIEGGWQDIETILGRQELRALRKGYFRAYQGGELSN